MVRLHQASVVRIFHTTNLLAVWAMIGSGLQIYSANPVFGGRSGLAAPRIFTTGGWLAGGRHWHFFFMWVFALNLLWYGVYLLISSRGRRHYPNISDLKTLEVGTNPKGVQYMWHRITIALMVVTLLFSLYTGLGMYKPVQFSWIIATFGNSWQALRIAHFLPVVLLVILIWDHIGRGFKIGG